MDTSLKLAVLALDQSTSHVGWSVWIDGNFESCGEYLPDWPNCDEFRLWIRDFILQFITDGYHPVLAIEDIYLGKNAETFKILATLRGMCWSAGRDAGAEIRVVTANAALFALTGKAGLKTDDRKRAMIFAATTEFNRMVSEHMADAIGIGQALFRKKPV